MPRYTVEKMNETFAKMPEHIRSVMFSEQRIDATKKIQERYQLHIDQLGKLIDEIGYVFVGLEKSTDFTKNIKESLGLEQPTAEQVATDCNNEIFAKIRESLKQMEENKNTPKPEELLKEINATPNIFEQKLGGSVNIRPIDNSLTINPDTPSTLPPRGPSVHFDPYHEPTN